MQWRRHNYQIAQIAKDLVAGIRDNCSVALDCTPGGGKTGSATLFANLLLDERFVERVLWIVPRKSLAEQVIDGFAHGFGSVRGRTLEVADPNDLLFPSTLPGMPTVVGHVTTYQSIASKNYRRFLEAMKNKRTLVIFDEVQFLCDEDISGWIRNAKRIEEASAASLSMTGTAWRTDNGRIPFLKYGPDEKKADGKLYPKCDISYSLRDAIAERAVLPIEWVNRGGSVEYLDNGLHCVENLAADAGDEEFKKLRTFLSDDKSVGVIFDDMVDHWREWCRRKYQSRMLVIADDTQQARRWRRFLQDRHNIACVLATCKEEAAGRKLRHFRERRHGQCLVTVAMAYVGFDCPDLTHEAYLSTTRAPSWMLQSFARITRFDSNAPIDYDSQHAFVFAPDDAQFREFLRRVRAEQTWGILDRQGRSSPAKPTEYISVPEQFEPLSAFPGDFVIESLAGRIDSETVRLLDLFIAKNPAAANIPRSQLYEILKAAGVDLKIVARAGENHAFRPTC